MILITGANGLLGSFITKELIASGYEVVALVRKNADLSLLDETESKLHLAEGDILDIVSLQNIFEKYAIEKIIHAAAVVSFLPKDYEHMHLVNVEGTKNIINVALHHSVNKFVHISSVAAIGRSSNGQSDEKTLWNNSGYNSKYGISKREAEVEVWRGQVEGLNTVIINPSLILAAGDGNRSSSKFFSFIKKESWFYPTGNLNYVDIRDVASIIVKLLDSNYCNERFIVSAGATSYKEFFTKAAERQGLKPPRFPVKKITGFMALFADKIRSSIGNKEPMLSSENLRVSRSKAEFDNSKIKSKLNYQFRPLEDTIDWVWKEFKFRKQIDK